MMDEKREITSSKPIEQAADTISTIVSAAPWLGGPVSVILSGWVIDRKFGRVEEVLRTLADGVKDLNTDSAQRYVATVDFRDLLVATLQKVQDERGEEKRRAYAWFLQADMREPGQSYDDKIEMLRVLEQLQHEHLRLLKAMRQTPEPGLDRFGITSLLATLKHRLPDISSDRIKELAARVDDLRIAKVAEGLQTSMTPIGAADLRSRFTPFGMRFLKFLEP